MRTRTNLFRPAPSPDKAPLLLRLAAALLAAIPLAAAAGPPQPALDAARAALARTAGTVHVPGLRAPVQVLRDRWGVPHIRAANTHDLFMAQGYVVAQDRLFQMELWKRTGQGRLAEVLGPAAVERDIAARLLRYRGDLEAEYRSYAPDARQILEAFTAGINARIDEVTAPGSTQLPVEFRLADFRPEHWSPEDCLNRLAAYSMLGNAASELLHAALIERLGPERATMLLDLDPQVPLTKPAGADYRGLAPALLERIVPSDRRIPMPAHPLHESNNWTIAGRLSRSGRPLLANDPHRVIALPSLRYIVQLEAPGWNVIGAGEPALPGVAVGHNESIAWGFTIFGLDQEDLYLESLDPADRGRYRTPSGWEAVRELHEAVRVRGAPERSVTLRFTRHGPILWEDGERALALRWVGSEPGTAGYLGSLALDRAHDWREFEAAMPRWKLPSENIVYADRNGNIGEHSVGLAPLRHGFSGLVPLPGASGLEWSGWIPVSELPHSFNPAQGFIATANQRMIPDGYAYAVGYEWAPPVRWQRIVDVLGAGGTSGRTLAVADLQALQTDVTSLTAQRLLVLLRAVPEELAAPAAAGRELLAGWNGALAATSAPAALYEMWGTELARGYAARAIPPAARDLLPELGLYETVGRLEHPAAEVFGTDAGRARDALLVDTLATAWGKLLARLGPDPARWSWGALHRAQLRHPLDGGAGLAVMLDPPPIARGGDGDTVMATGFDPGSWVQTSGASYRQIFDLADWDAAVATNAPGQSGQPASPHYADLLPLWGAGEYFPLRFTHAAVEAVTSERLVLEP